MRNDATLVVFLAAALCVPAVSHAQTTGPRRFVIGTDFASGNFSHSSYENSSDSSTTVYTSKTTSGYGQISPSLGVFLNDKLLIGSAVGFGVSHYSSDSLYDDVLDSTGKTHSISASVGPFLRKYFGNPQGHGMPFVQVEGGLSFNIYGGTYTPVSSDGYKYDQTNYLSKYVQVLAGYEMFITEMLGLEYYGGYSYGSYKYDYVYDYPTDPDSTYHYKGKNNDIVFGIGLKVYLRGGK